jgi:drug/metabolite transporter, DME family
MALAAAIVWGTSWVATGLALRDFAAEAIAAWRGAGGLVLIVAYLAIVSRRWAAPADAPPTSTARPRSGRWLRYLALALLGGPWFVLGMTVAVELTGATISAFVGGLYPVIAAVGAPLLLPERPSAAAVGGLLAAFVGILLLAGFDPVGLPIEGIVIALGVAVFFALFLLLARRWSEPWGLSPLRVTLANFSLLTLFAVPLTLWVSPHPMIPAATAAAWLALGWLIVGPGVLANLSMLGSVRRLQAHESSAYLMLAPLAAAVLAVPLLDERLAPVQLIGAGLVLAGIAAATLPLRALVARVSQ